MSAPPHHTPSSQAVSYTPSAPHAIYRTSDLRKAADSALKSRGRHRGAHYEIGTEAELRMPPRVPGDFHRATPLARDRDVPSSAELIVLERGFLGESVERCRMSSRPGTQVSNPKSSRRNVFVNGMNSNVEKLHLDLTAMCEVFGCDFTALINDQDRLTIREPLFSVLGALSARLGYQAEAASIEKVLSELRSANRDRAELRLVCFSQGSIIVSNALELFRRSCTASAWDSICSRISVVAFGAATLRWPSGIQVESFSHSADSVASLSRHISRLGELLHPLQQTVEPVTVAPHSASLSHALNEYGRNYPRFLIARHSDEHGRANQKTLAEAVYRNILDGRCADWVSRAIIEIMKHDGAEEFCSTLRAYSVKGKIGGFNLNAVLRKNAGKTRP